MLFLFFLGQQTLWSNVIQSGNFIRGLSPISPKKRSKPEPKPGPKRIDVICKSVSHDKGEKKLAQCKVVSQHVAGTWILRDITICSAMSSSAARLPRNVSSEF